MNKKVLSLVLALAIVLGSFGTVALASNVEYNSQEQKIQWLIDNEHVVGRKVNEDGSADLALEDNVTRAEITKLLVHILGKTDLAEVLDGVMRPFPDVTIEHWANGYISVATTTRANTANDNRIVIGYPDGNFYPENNVTYAELATMLVRIVKDDLTTKMEADSIWATSYMRWAEEEGILEGLTITNSDRAITRADAFEMIYNAFFNMGQINDVDFGDDLGIVSRLGNGEIQLNQDADKVYKIDSNTLLTDGTTWESLLDNIDAPLRGSLVRLIVDKDGNVTHLIELGNPRELALENNQYSRWFGIAEKTAETNTVAEKFAKFSVVGRRHVDLTVDGVKAEINNATRIFVADVKNNALTEVDTVADAFILFGIEEENVDKVYMGYNEFDSHKEAKVIVFNSIENYFGEKATVRITGGLNSLYRFEAENTKGVKKAYDVSNLPLFPTNDLLGAMDVVEITDNPNVQYREELIKIDYSKDNVYEVVSVQAGNRRVTLIDKDGFQRALEVSRDVMVFLEGQLEAGAHVQVDNENLVEIISVVDADLRGELVGGVRERSVTGTLVDAIVTGDHQEYPYMIRVDIGRGIVEDYNVAEIDDEYMAFLLEAIENDYYKLPISFNVRYERGETPVAYDFDFDDDDVAFAVFNQNQLQDALDGDAEVIVLYGEFDGFRVDRGVRIVGGTITPNWILGDLAAIYVNTDEEVVIDGVEIESDGTGNGVVTSGAFNPNVVVINSQFTDLGMGVYFNPGASGEIKNNQFTDMGHVAIGIDSVEEVVITGNRGTNAGIGIEDFGGAVVESNNIWN